MTREQQDRLAAEHVLGLLEGEEQTLAERLLASDRAFRDSVDRWRSHFAEFDETAPAVATATANECGCTVLMRLVRSTIPSTRPVSGSCTGAAAHVHCWTTSL